MGRNFFIRRQTGYSLTKDGQALLTHVLAMNEAARSIGAWNEGVNELPDGAYFSWQLDVAFHGGQSGAAMDA